MTVLAYRIRQAHLLALAYAEDLTEEHLHWSPGKFAPSIAFHLWHTARWTDRLQAMLREMTGALKQRLSPAGQVWDEEQLAEQWGLDPAVLGPAATGMAMDDDVSAGLKLPARERLFDYVRRAFGAMEETIALVRDDDLFDRCADQYRQDTSVGSALISHVSHVNRHLGNMEALRGMLGVPGTASNRMFGLF